MSLVILSFILCCQKINKTKVDKQTGLGYDFLKFHRGDYLIPISENVFISWDPEIGDLNYKLTYNDSIDIINELLCTIKDTTKTIISNCYLEEVNNKLTKGQLAFWVLWYIKPFSFEDVLGIEMDFFGPNHKDTIYSGCKYPAGFMEFGFKSKDKIALKLAEYYKSIDDSNYVDIPIFRHNNATNPRILNSLTVDSCENGYSRDNRSEAELTDQREVKANKPLRYNEVV